jgi:para-nitrobenzyl esterase
MRRREFLVGVGMASLAGAGMASDRPPPVVHIRNGRVRGRFEHGVRVFTGIPYAEPPVGRLRFKASRPARPWRGELEALGDARTPPQNEDPSLPPVAPISEDCLQLNVWAPAGPGPYPVFVWIYGGGNYTGASNQPAYKGDTFARDGVVFVSFNYRVGVLGFLELGEILGPTEAGSGNNAIRDQVLALQWVKENISAFGGDPQNMTIGGQSAGAWNCSTLLALPAARGLFQRAIVASGGGDAVYTLKRAGDFARLFVDRLGGPLRLRTAATSAILEAQQAAQSEFEDLIPYRPVIDGSFLPAAPMDLIRAGRARNITTMIGHTRDEYRTFLSPAQAADSISQKMFLNFRIAELPRVDKAYATAFPDLTRGERMLKILGDEVIGIPSLKLAEAQAGAGATVFYYHLTYSISDGPFGAYSAHGIDVPLIFEHVDTAFARNVFGFHQTDQAMARRVHGAWVSFIKSGQIDRGLPGWPPYELEHRRAMVIDEVPSVATDLEHAQRLVWMSDSKAP